MEFPPESANLRAHQDARGTYAVECSADSPVLMDTGGNLKTWNLARGSVYGSKQ